MICDHLKGCPSLADSQGTAWLQGRNISLDDFFSSVVGKEQDVPLDLKRVFFACERWQRQEEGITMF